MKSYSTMIAASIIFIISICEADIIQRLGGERACLVFSNNSKICSVNINGYSAPIVVIIPNGVENPSIIVLQIHGFQGYAERTQRTRER